MTWVWMLSALFILSSPYLRTLWRGARGGSRRTRRWTRSGRRARLGRGRSSGSSASLRKWKWDHSYFKRLTEKVKVIRWKWQLTNTVANPRTVMVKPLNAVITNGTMRGARGAKDLAGEAVLQLHRLPFHLGRWRSVRKHLNQIQKRLQPLKFKRICKMDKYSGKIDKLTKFTLGLYFIRNVRTVQNIFSRVGWGQNIWMDGWMDGEDSRKTRFVQFREEG